jgi:single-stranded-DNA-specific exonuclease
LIVNKRWQILPGNQSQIAELKQSLKVSEPLCHILTSRGITDYDKAKSFFRPTLDNLHDPFLMKDMQKAVNRIERAIVQEEKILVFGDYDVDGTTAVASMYRFICSIHNPSKTDFYIPHRYKEGYGVSKAGIDFAHENYFSLIICLDCGIKSFELIAYAKALNIDFIIADHHLPGNDLPEAAAILNPKQADCPYPYKDLCGCGIGFKLMSALASHFSLEKESYLCYLDLVATAIAADIVPLNGENRILAFYGMKKINENPSPGIETLMTLGAAKKPLNISNVVFIIAPRVNAAGRMDDARKAVDLFIETDLNKAFELAKPLQSDNTDRKEIDKIITEEALQIIEANPSFIEKKSCVLYKKDWHKGVVGIVASRVIEHHYKPTIVLTLSNNIITGSARSVKGFNLFEAIYACKEYLLHYGGHFAAAGLSLLPENINAFIDKFEAVVSDTIEEHMLIPEITIDCEIELNEINYAMYNILSQLEPFGPENMKPLFLTKEVKDNGYAKLLKEKHIKFSATKNGVKFDAIAFNMAHKFESIKNSQSIDIVYSIEENDYMGNKSLQLNIVDFRPSCCK